MPRMQGPLWLWALCAPDRLPQGPQPSLGPASTNSYFPCICQKSTPGRTGSQASLDMLELNPLHTPGQ